MRDILKKLFPEQLIVVIRNKTLAYKLNAYYSFDKKRFKKYAYQFRDSYTEDNLRSKITFHYHAIEKGLSNANLRLGFGEKAFKQLFNAMDKYIELNYSTEDSRFQSAISVIQSYVNMHKKNDFLVEDIEGRLVKYSKYIINKKRDNGGYVTLNKGELPDFRELSFKELSNNRYSVRDFADTEVKDTHIFDAVQIATKTPSVCNRQSWNVHYIKNQNIVEKVLKLQGGLTGNGENLSKLLLVTCDKQYMMGPQERNQTYIDGGLFTMSLLYALESEGLATCTLNTNYTINIEKMMRKILDISMSEDLIAFVAIGNYPEIFKVAKSPRDSTDKIVNVIN